VWALCALPAELLKGRHVSTGSPSAGAGGCLRGFVSRPAHGCFPAGAAPPRPPGYLQFLLRSAELPGAANKPGQAPSFWASVPHFTFHPISSITASQDEPVQGRLPLNLRAGF